MELEVLGFETLMAFTGAGIAIGFGAMGAAIGEGFIAMQAVQGLGRQPKAEGKIIRTMLIGQAVTETASIFALVIAFMLLFRPDGNSLIQGISLVAAGIAAGVGSIGSGVGSGLPGGAACDGTARNPGNADKLTLTMLIGQAICQSGAIFSLVIAFILMRTSTATDHPIITITILLGAGLCIGFGAIGPGIGEGYAAKKAVEAISKTPEEQGLLTRIMLVGQAITETTLIYAVVIALILVFVV